MIRSKFCFSSASALILASALLASAPAANAQRHGGGGLGGGSLSGNSRPSGVKEEDSLKDFHEAMAVQATSQQIAEFQTLVKSSEAAKAELHKFLEGLHAGAEAPESNGLKALNLALENARTENKKFQQGFSAAQKSGLKDVTKRLARSDSDLEQEEKRLDQSSGGPEITARAESLNKVFADFSVQQLALGREMSITLASGQDLAFTIPPVSHPVSIANQTIGIPVSAALAQTAAQGGRRTFKLDLTADLTDLQQNITEILRAQLDRSDGCGQRIAIQQATLMPSTPASLLVMKLHFERWTCERTLGRQTSTELAEEDGTVELKLTATIENMAIENGEKPNPLPHTLKVAATLGRIDAAGMMADALRSGSLGEDLRSGVAQVLLTAAQMGSDLRNALPPAVQNSATIESARFQDTGAGGVSVVLHGQIEISNEQADALASQLNQALSAQGTPPR